MGPSNIPAWALKDSISVIAEHLCFLINAFLNEDKFPIDLKQAHVCPIFKKGDTEDPNNSTLHLFLLQHLYPRFSKKSIVNKLPTILITTNFFPRYNLVSGNLHISTTDSLVFTNEKNRKGN